MCQLDQGERVRAKLQSEPRIRRGQHLDTGSGQLRGLHQNAMLLERRESRLAHRLPGGERGAVVAIDQPYIGALRA